MADYDKVVKGLEELRDHLFHEYKVCYHGDEEDVYRRFLVVDDALLLICKQQEQLKEHEWRKFEFREPNAEEKASHPNWIKVLPDPPDDDQEILVSNGRYGWKDIFINDGDECYLDSGVDLEECWWMPLPELPERIDTRNVQISDSKGEQDE